MKLGSIRMMVAMVLMGSLWFGVGSAQAVEDFKIVIKDHQFDPPELVVPTQKKIKILVENQDPSAEEFESYDLNREKVIAGNSKATIFIGPLKPGTYKYFGEFNPKTAQGAIVAKD